MFHEKMVDFFFFRKGANQAVCACSWVNSLWSRSGYYNYGRWV